jgi:hypothetical protein
MDESNYKRLVSVACACGAEVPQRTGSGRKRKHCSDYCKDKAANRNLRRAGIRQFVCECCSMGFDAAIAAAYCSPKCRASAMWQAQKEQARADHNNTVKPVACRGCNALFSPLYGYWIKAVHCSECAEALPDSAWSIRRRNRIKAATVEVVERLVVFARDKWRCAICGVKTIKEPYQPRSAELDHIIPLSKGGEHSYLNTQCACRKCNGAKGARPKGQMLIFG